MSMTIRYHTFSLEFPQELSDHVFKAFRNDFSSLKHCSLVCKAWLHATRTQLFRKVVLTPQNIDSFISIIIDSHSTVQPHVRTLDIRRISYTDRWIISHFTPTLTQLHLRGMIFNDFIDILDIICSFPCLQFVSIDELTVKTRSGEKSDRIRDKVLPPSVRSVCCRGGCLRPFLSWLLQHQEIPKLSGLDVGPIKEESTFDIGKYLVSLGPAIKHLSLSFDFAHNTHTCALQEYGVRALLAGGPQDVNTSLIAQRYKALFGLDLCPNIAALTGLQSLRFDNFIHFEDHIHASALVWAPRILASNKAPALREVILSISLRRAGELDKFNIHWNFLDEAFTSIDGPFTSLVSLKFEINGKVKMDGIASLIRSRLPVCDKRGLLRFCRNSDRHIPYLF